jgi:DNA-binding NarL/FixJ family response regulator
MTEPHNALVGRDDELQVLGSLLEEGCSGAPRFAFVTGEPGIGKTSVLVDLVRRAEQRGCLTLQGSAAEFERELPFGVMVDAFDEYLASLEPRAFNRIAAEDLGELAGVFPALRSLDPGSDEPTTAGERFRAHRAVRELIERLAAPRPVVLVLDDIHWADGASLELITHLLRRPPAASVVVAATFRAGQADQTLEAAIEAAVRDGTGVRRMGLGPLTLGDAEALVGETGTGEVDRLYRASGGNPFYLLQLARMDGDADRRPSPAGGGVPAAVAAAIVAELDALSAPARRFADASAVAGDPFDLDLAVRTAGMREPDAVEALDELIARDLVRSTPVPRRFRFRHPLVRRAVYESCPPGARLAAHERTAEALVARGAPAAARAHHVEHSGRHGDLAAVALLREAGDQAAERAPESAARWFESALRLLPATAPRAERVGLLTALAGARAATGRFEESHAALLESIGLTNEDERALRVRLVGACAGVEQLLGRHGEAHDRLVAALRTAGESSSPQSVALMLQLAVGDFYRMEFEGMRAWGERALAASTALEATVLVAASEGVLAVAAAFVGATPDAEHHRSRAAALLDAVSDEEVGLRLDALATLCTAELYLQRFDAATAHARRGLAVGRATGQGDMSPVLIPVLSNCLHTTGRIAESAQLLEGAVEAARLSGNVEALGWNLLSRGFTALAAGDLELALSVSEESVQVTRHLDDNMVSTMAGVALASALFEAREARRAIEVLEAAAGGDELPLIPWGWRANYFELLTRCWLDLDHPLQAEQAATRAAVTAERVGLGMSVAMAHRAAAAVALEGGDAVQAADRALSAVGAAEAIGAPVDAAVARTLAGRAFARAGDRARAVSELERAAEQLDACGAVRHRKRAEQELRSLGEHVHRRTAAGSADGAGVETLTQREVEIARLVLRRQTNAEIAAELFLSVKTVESHLRNIFRKLGVASRVEVARALEDA